MDRFEIRDQLAELPEIIKNHLTPIPESGDFLLQQAGILKERLKMTLD